MPTLSGPFGHPGERVHKREGETMRAGLDSTRQELCASGLRPVGSNPWFWPVVAVLALPVLWGLSAYAVQLVRGLGVTGISNQYFWGLYETNLVTFIGYSNGSVLVSAGLRLTGVRWRAAISRLAEATALVTLLVGAAFAVAQLGRPDRIWRIFLAPQVSSPVLWNLLAIVTYMAALLLYLYLPLIPDLAMAAEWLGKGGGDLRRFYTVLSLGWRGLPAQRRLLTWACRGMAVLIVPVAITVQSVLGWTFSVHLRAGWHGATLGPEFVAGALFSGVALVILVVAAFRRIYRLEPFIGLEHFQCLGLLLLVLGPLYLYFACADLLQESYLLTERSAILLTLLLRTDYAVAFWSSVTLGVVLPALLLTWPRTRTVAGIVVAAALVVGSMWLKRFLVIVPTLAVPVVAHAASQPLYSPTWAEISLTLAGAAAVPLLLALFFLAFPVLALFELDEAARTANRSG